MQLRQILGSLAGLSLLASSAALSAEPAADCALKQLASLDLVDGPDSTVMVPATIDGANEFMVVDTAAIMSGIFSTTASSLGLRSSGRMAHAPFFDLGGGEHTMLVQIPRLGLGNMIGENLTFLWLAPSRKPPAAGLLGQDILRKYDLDFDFAARKLNLFSPDHCAGHVVYWAAAYDEIPVTIRGNGLIEVAVTLDGKSVRAVISTVLPTTMISMDAADSLFGITKDSPGVQHNAGAQPGDPVQFRYRFKALSFGSVQAPDPLIDLLPNLARDRMDMEANPLLREGISVPPFFIGMDVLRKLHLYVAYREQKIYVTSADAGKPMVASSPSPAGALTQNRH